MKTPPVLTSARVASIMDQWRMDAYRTDQDRAELMRHYNGGALQEDDDEAGRNTPNRANLLFGNRLLRTPATRLFSTINQGIGLLSGAMKHTPNVPASRRKFIEQIVNIEINKVIAESGQLYWPYRAVSGDAVIWGSSFLYRDDRFDWVPKYGRMYHEWDAPPDITLDKFAEWGFTGELTCSEIFSRLERLKDVNDEDSYWDKAALRSIAEKIIKRHDPDSAWSWPADSDSFLDPIAVREKVQAQAWGASAIASTLPVYWFFSKRFDDSHGREIDLYCIPRLGESCVESKSAKLTIKRDKDAMGDVLFYQPKAFDHVRECLFPFIVSAQLGGKPMLRRVLGLGTLNYDLDVKIQNNVHMGMESAEFSGMPLFQENDSASAQDLQDLTAAGIRPYDVLPRGVGFMDKPTGNFPFKQSLDYVAMLNGKMEENSTSSFGTGDSGKRGKEELEVAVLERQQQNATILADSMGDWAKSADPMCAAIGQTILSGDLLDCDAAAPTQAVLRERLEERGINWLEVEDQFVWTMRRAPGHGDPGLALNRARQTYEISKQLGPAAQQSALRDLIAAINGGDVELAMEMVPNSPPTSEQDQMNAAMGQNAVAIATGQPPIARETDMVQVHAPVHLGALARMMQNGMQAGDKWTPQNQQAFEALAAHAMTDLRRLGAIDERMAKSLQQQLMQMVGKVSNFQVGTDVQSPIDAVDAAKLQIAQQKLEQANQFKQLDFQKWRQTQQHRQQSAAFNESLQMGYLNESEATNKVKRAAQIIKAVKDAQQPSSIEP